jgi:RNA polymerase sigma-70 factor (ECF subfamily)
MARKGDDDGLAALWCGHQAPLLRYVRGRGIDDPEDVTMQVWVDVARNLGRFHGGADEFRPWLFTIAHRRVVDETRRWARRMAARQVRAEDGPGADVDFDRRDALDRALALVSLLPDQMGEAVLLRVVADLSVADTARIMRVREGHVRVLVHRGLRRLQRMLEADVDGAVTLSPLPTMKGLT